MSDIATIETLAASVMHPADPVQALYESAGLRERYRCHYRTVPPRG